MFLTNQQERTKRGVLKTARDLEMEIQLRDDMKKRKKKIQFKHLQFVPNLIYVFPRTSISDSLSSEEQQLDFNAQEDSSYDLHSQNRKNKNYQTQTNSSMAVLHARCLSTGEAAIRPDSGPKQLIKSHKKLREDSQSRYQTRKTKEDKSSARQPKYQEVNLSNYNSRKGDKTALNSSKKLIVAQQFSLSNHNARTKKVSQAHTLTCRRKNPPRSRITTQQS